MWATHPAAEIPSSASNCTCICVDLLRHTRPSNTPSGKCNVNNESFFLLYQYLSQSRRCFEHDFIIFCHFDKWEAC